MNSNPTSATDIETRKISPEYKYEHHHVLGNAV